MAYSYLDIVIEIDHSTPHALVKISKYVYIIIPYTLFQNILSKIS